MKYLSKIFQPIITIPRNAKLKNTEVTCRSQKLLLECGLIRPMSPGFFCLLPLARRALDKLENIIKSCIESEGAQRVSLPALTSSKLWAATGRLTDVGPELMKLEDRHGKRYLLSPTHEEAIADLLSDVGPLSYKQLPLLLYQISNKYRDEHRPKHGLLRSREFLMCDTYGAHNTEECARSTYERVSGAYERVFSTLGLTVHRVEAPPGEMGGSVSHEWQLPAPTGEDRTMAASSVEVAHTFMLGTKYSEPLNATVAPSNDHVYMTCYGIGITRLLAASLEALSSETALRWPTAIAPYKAVIIGPKEGSKEWQLHGVDRIQQLVGDVSALPEYRGDVLVDDRHQLTVGKRLLLAEKMGYPVVIVCGRACVTSQYELRIAGAEPKLLIRDELLNSLQGVSEKMKINV